MPSRTGTLNYSYKLAHIDNSAFTGPRQEVDVETYYDATYEEAISPLNDDRPNPLITRPVLHTKHNYILQFGGSVRIGADKFPWYSGITLNHVSNASLFYLSRTGTPSVTTAGVDAIQWNKAVYDALVSAIPAPPANVSIINSIIELKDLAQFEGTVKKFNKSFKRLGVRRQKHLRKLTVRYAISYLM